MAIIKLAEGDVLNNDVPASEALADIEITNRFIKLAQQIKKLAPRSDDFLYFTAIMLHASEASLIDPKTGDPLKDRSGNVITGGFDENWKWSCSDPSIQPYMNQNKDTFPEAELKLAYKKWTGRPLCVNHVSNDIEGIRGIIIDTHYDEKFKRVVGLCAVDAKTYPDLAFKIKSRYATSVSMGTAVSKAVCLKCGNAAVTEKDYCDCMRAKSGEINVGLNPIELSLVVTPADANAKVIKIIASMNNYLDQRNELLESKDKAETTKFDKLDTSIKNVETQLNRLFSECSDSACQFVRTADGHIKIVKHAQEDASWSAYFGLAKQVDAIKKDAAEKAALLEQMAAMRGKLDINKLDQDILQKFLDVAISTKDPELREKELNPLLAEWTASLTGHPQPMQDHQLTTPNGPDKDLGLDGGSEVTMPADEQQTGARISKVVNPSEVNVKPNQGGDLGPELGSASDKYQFGNYASNEMLMAKGGKKTADIDENLNLLLKQTQEIEREMNKMREELKSTNTTNTAIDDNKTAIAMEDSKMNEARLKLRAAQRQALLEKKADHCEKCESDDVCKECEKCDEHCKCPAEKKAYFQGGGGVNEPTPGKPKYKPDNGGEPKNRMNDKQMHQDKSMGGADGAFPGDEAEKKKLLRAELERRALERRAYFQGTTEPTPGKPQYKPDNGGEPKNRMNDKQMKQDKSMGGADGAFPGDESEKKKLLRAELAPGVLRTKFTRLRNPDGSFNKEASYFEIFAGEQNLLKATAEEIYGDELNKPVEGADGKTGWEVLQMPEYGKQVMAKVREDGFDKVAALLKGAQAMPEMPAMEGAPAEAPALPEAGAAEPKVQVDANQLMELLQQQEENLDKMRTALTGESEEAVKDVEVSKPEEGGEAEAAGAELTAQIQNLGREIYADLDKSADEIALLVDYFEKSASLSDAKKAELQKLAADAVADGQALLEEAETIMAVAGKVPAGLKAFQEKQKAKKKDNGKDEGKKAKDKKDDKKEDKKKDEKKDDKKKGKKKSKKAELVEALLKLASELETDEDGELEIVEATDEGEVVTAADEMDKEMKELGLADKKEENACGLCGMAMDDAHACTADAKDDLVKEALAARKAKREALLKSAEEKKYDVMPDDHGMQSEAHPGKGTTTQLDIKPAGDGANVETIDERHKQMMDAANAAPTGKQGEADVGAVKEAEIKAELDESVKAKKAETDKTAYRVKLRRAYDLGLAMQEKGMIPRTKEALDSQVDEVMKFDDQAFESYKRVVANTRTPVSMKTAAAKAVPQVGVREDNSQPGDNVEPDFVDQLKKLW